MQTFFSISLKKKKGINKAGSSGCEQAARLQENLGSHNPTHNVSAGKDLNYYC